MLLRPYTAYKKKNSKLRGMLFKLLFSSRRLVVGRGFECDTFPSLLVDEGCIISIGDNVLFRRDVEIRVHSGSTLIIGNNVRIDRGVRLLVTNRSKIGLADGVRIGLYSVLNAGESITVGKNALISGFVYLQTSMHAHGKGLSIQEQGFSHAPIVLEDDTWLGAHVVVLPGCTIKEGSIVGSNAVVTKSIEKGKIYGGVPAKILNER